MFNGPLESIKSFHFCGEFSFRTNAAWVTMDFRFLLNKKEGRKKVARLYFYPPSPWHDSSNVTFFSQFWYQFCHCWQWRSTFFRHLMYQIDGKLTNRLAFMFLSSWVLLDKTCNEILVLKVDATKTEAYQTENKRILSQPLSSSSSLSSLL